MNEAWLSEWCVVSGQFFLDESQLLMPAHHIRTPDHFFFVCMCDCGWCYFFFALVGEMVCYYCIGSKDSFFSSVRCVYQVVI